jgi:peptidoglycan hydrolase CwlO-like protein
MAFHTEDTGIIITIAFSACSLATVLIGVIYSTLKSEIEKLKTHDEDKQLRLVKLETEKEHELKALKKDLDEVKSELKSLKEYVHEYIHAERNNSQRMAETLERISDALHGAVR